MSNVLTKIVHGSAPFITTFLLIHLSAPTLANLGGTSLASQVMILGREYYQTSFGHRYLVIVPIVAHTLSAVSKRLFSQRTARKLTSVFSVTGYAALGCFVPVHYLIHRVLPSNPNPPILSVGPAELDFEYVKYGLQEWPWLNWALYTGLVVCVAWHASEGMQIIWNTWMTGRFGIWKNNAKRRAVVVLAAIVPIFTGILAISREPLMVFTSTAERYDAAFRQFVFFR